MPRPIGVRPRGVDQRLPGQPADDGLVAASPHPERSPRHPLRGPLALPDRPSAPRPPLSLVTRAYLEIRARIVHGVYRPGAHLSQATLGRVHRASRTPIREALSRLCEDGFVVATPGRGFLIAPVTLHRVAALLEARRLLEAGVAALAAEAATAEEIDAMADALAPRHGRAGAGARQTAVARERPHRAGGDGQGRGDEAPRAGRAGEAAGAAGRAVERNLSFHRAVACGSHNEVLVDLVERCVMELGRVLSLGVDLPLLDAHAASQHEAIVQAIRRRDPASARAASEQHADATREALLAALVAGRVRGVVV